MEDLLDPIRNESLPDMFVARLEKLILSGQLAIGRKLPPERELAQQLGVSRPVVHEGLVDLAFKGLVSMRPRVGAVVNDYRKEGSLAVLVSLMHYHNGGLDPKLLRSSLAMRRLFEMETARLAAANRTKEHLGAFRAVLAEEKIADRGNAESISNIDFRFHHLIALASDNFVYPLLLNTFRQFYTAMTRIFFGNPGVIPIVFQFHRKLVSQIADGDENAAANTMEKILEHGEKHLLSNMPSK
jgi:GntR family transcriptional regulator, transcriptional repressor for pyruvate dehydrogenase complex